jgi:hypothetical protein
MQLTLTSPGRATLGANAAPTRTVASPSRAQSLSQLDRIAAANSMSSSPGPTGVATWLGLLGGCLLVAVAAMWQDGTGSPGMSARDDATQTVAADVTAVTADPDASRAAAPAAPNTAAVTFATDAPLPAPSRAAEPAPVAEWVAPPAPPAPSADEVARKSRLAAAAETRRKAALAAQERAQAEEAQRLALVQQQTQREASARAEQAAEAARQRAAAAEQVRMAALSGAEAPRVTVRASCASAGGFLAQQFCQARECSKAEHQGDAVCARLRESEAERLRASIDR